MTEQPPTSPYAATPNPMRPEDEKTWAILTHIGGLFVPLIGPLIVYLVLRDRGPFIRHHSATAFNFHVTMTLASIVGGILTLVLVGIVILAAVGILWFVLAIVAALAAGRGDFYTYPLSIPFVR